MSRVDGSRWRCKADDGKCDELVEQGDMMEHLADEHSLFPKTPEDVLALYALAIGNANRGYFRQDKGKDETPEMFPDWREHRMSDRERP